MPSPEISLVITIYNEEESLRPLQRKITDAMQYLGRLYEVIYVDDGSLDSSPAILADLADSDKQIRVITFPKNRGKSAGLAAGFAAAVAPIIVTLDADLQDEPSEIGKLLAKLEEGYDLVIGWKSPRRDPLSKTFPSKVINFVNSCVSGLRIHDVDSGLKVYRRQVVSHLELRGDLYRFIPVMADAAGFRVTEVPVRHNARRFSHSKYGARRFLTGFLDLGSTLAVTRLRDRPAHLGLLVGAIASGPAAALAGLAVFRLSSQRSQSERAVTSIVAGTSVTAWTTLVFAGLGIMLEPTISRIRAEGRRDGYERMDVCISSAQRLAGPESAAVVSSAVSDSDR